MEMISSVSKTLHDYERAGGFAPHAASEASKAVLEAPAAAPPPTGEGQEAPLPQSAEAAGTTAASVTTGATEVVVGEAGPSPPAQSSPVPKRFACRTSPPEPFRSELLPRV
jgi:hypothetical protein